MDFTGFDIGALLTSAGAIVKAFLSDNKAKKAEANIITIRREREDSVSQRDNEIRELSNKLISLENKQEAFGKRLDEGGERFKLIDQQLSEISGTLKELKGMFEMYLKMSGRLSDGSKG